MDFRALKAMSIKRNIRIEVGDVENILGTCHTETIQVTGEAYDVALDMSFPRGTDGGLDFGTVRVFEEPKQTCSLKNKGIRYNHFFVTFFASFVLTDYLDDFYCRWLENSVIETGIVEKFL